MQAYSDPKRESDPHALPDVEVFELDRVYNSHQGFIADEPGWYWWSCFPGCIPDCDPFGPFASYELALADAREVVE